MRRDLVFTMRDIYTNSNVNLIPWSSTLSTDLSLSTDYGDHLNPHESNHKLYDEMGHLFLSLKEIQWKLRQK